MTPPAGAETTMVSEYEEPRSIVMSEYIAMLRVYRKGEYRT